MTNMVETDKSSKLLNGIPVKCEATLFDRLKIELRWFLGSVLNLLGSPGLVKPVQVYDELTNTNIQIAVHQLFTVVSINGNDYYFRRLDGEYDGSGKHIAGTF